MESSQQVTGNDNFESGGFNSGGVSSIQVDNKVSSSNNRPNETPSPLNAGESIRKTPDGHHLAMGSEPLNAGNTDIDLDNLN